MVGRGRKQEGIGRDVLDECSDRWTGGAKAGHVQGTRGVREEKDYGGGLVRRRHTGNGMACSAVQEFGFERGEDKGCAGPWLREWVVYGTEEAIGRMKGEVGER